MKKVITIGATNGNCTPLVVAAIKNAPPNSVIKFQRGCTYHFFAEGCYQGMFYPADNKSSHKQVVFPILNKHGLTIDGNGADFVIHGRIFPFIVQNSSNVTLKNFQLDTSYPRHYEAVVVDSTNDYVDFYVDSAKYPYRTEKGNFICLLEDGEFSSAKTRFFLNDYDKDVDEGTTFTSMLLGDSTFDMANWPADGLKVDATEIGNDVVRLTYRQGSPKLTYYKGHHIMINYDEERDNDVFFLDNNRNVTLRNVQVYRGAGMGIIGQATENILLDRFRISVKPGRDERITTSADALHFVNCSGKLTLKNCAIQNSLDDGCNILGMYTIVDDVQGNTISCHIGHREQLGFNPYKPGDVLDFVDHVTLDKKGHCTVVNSVMHNDITHLTLTVSNWQAQNVAVGDYIENPQRMPKVTFVNTRFVNCPSILISSPQKVVLKGNYIKNKGAGLRILDYPDIWCSAGRSHNVLVKNNVFDRCAEGYDEHVIIVMETSYHGDGEVFVHENIRIVGNTFVGKNPKLFQIWHAKNCVVANNRYFSTKLGVVDQRQCFNLKSSKNIVAKNNVVVSE